MKKILPFIFLVLFFLFIPIVYAEENIVIESIELDSKSDNATIVNEATSEGLSINFDIKFEKVNDFVKYKMVINNKTNVDYKISDVASDSEYITYDFFDEDDDVLKKNSETVVYLTIKYVKKLPNEAYDNTIFVETNNMKINLVNVSQVENPETKSGLFIIIVILLISFVLLFITKNYKYKKYLALLIVCLSLVPLNMVGAIEQLEIAITSKVTIERKPYAKDVLLIDTESDIKTPYVLYTLKNGEDVLCRVLYDKNTQYGLQIVTANPIATVRLGYNDPKVSGETDMKKAQNSYMRAVTTLNEEAMEYKDVNGIATDVRSVGSKPLDKNYPDYLTGDERTSLYWYPTGVSVPYWARSFVNSFFAGDYIYETDEGQLSALGILGFEDTSIASSYWMASRYTASLIGVHAVGGQFLVYIYFGVLAYTYDEMYDYGTDLFGAHEDYGTAYYDVEKGLRPVFIIGDTVVVSRGDGTLTNPYVLELEE